ncbi:hypothetical protein DFA_04166 [Cavenderia fasciculata]|uniref:Ankyrin repeat-containing protein n=1 Tax=Cavenderia fasciculata TaxID=261658 RepID=F4Q1G9_CACFS|nr:uncharacterized protein DFA_04166 [Cavenderia fasciculata]EGG18670.1 hypothetical protein DFA_04166 [Cavenderia fasciculata]|eukprot:XP_004366574.1 hypothetical protein DFA_04166 [Cavenderia fasciculata]
MYCNISSNSVSSSLQDGTGSLGSSVVDSIGCVGSTVNNGIGGSGGTRRNPVLHGRRMSCQHIFNTNVDHIDLVIQLIHHVNFNDPALYKNICHKLLAQQACHVFFISKHRPLLDCDGWPYLEVGIKKKKKKKEITNHSIMSFFDIFRQRYISQLIFRHVEEISINQPTSLKGRDIVKLPFLGMISTYAMPWDFIKHYLSTRDHFIKKRRANVITSYCSHRNARVDTFQSLLDWSPDYDPRDCSVVSHYNTLSSRIAGHGNIDLLKFLISTYPDLPLQETFKSAAEAGHLNIIEYLNNTTKHAFCCKAVMDIAAANGHLNVVDYLHRNRTEGCTIYAMTIAAQNCHLNVVQYLHQNRIEGCNKEAIDIASENCHFNIVKFLIENRTEGCSKDAIDNASKNGHLNIIQYLDSKGKKCTTNAIDWASQNGHFEIVKWLYNNKNSGASKFAMNYAANLEILEYLHNIGQSCSTTAMDNAAKIDLEMVKFLHTKRTEGCTTNAIDNASKNGHLNIIKYLNLNRTEGGTEKAIDFAVDGNQSMEMIRYLDDHLRQGCSHHAVEIAASKGRLDVIQFLHQRYPSSPDIWTTKVNDNACQAGHLEIVTFLFENRTEGCSIDSVIGATQNNHLNVLKYLQLQPIVQNNRFISTNTLNLAIEQCNLEMIEFLYIYSHRTSKSKRCDVGSLTRHLRLEDINHRVPRNFFDVLTFLFTNHMIKEIPNSSIEHIESLGLYEIVNLYNQYNQSQKKEIDRKRKMNRFDFF